MVWNKSTSRMFDLLTGVDIKCLVIEYMLGKTHEIVFNQRFAQSLRCAKRRWRDNPRHIRVEESGNVSGKNKRPDIIIQTGQYPPLIIEASYDAQDANRDAKSRLGLNLRRSHHAVHSCIALHIPKSFQDVHDSQISDILLSGAELRYAFYRSGETVDRWPRSGFLIGDIYDIGT